MSTLEQAMLLCSTCGDAIPGDATCPTCGEPHPQTPHQDVEPRLNEHLLDQVGVALAAQAALARRIGHARSARAAELASDAIQLRGRLQTQAELLRSLVLDRPRRPSPAMLKALDGIDAALAGARREPGATWQLRIGLPRDNSCATVARRLLREYVRDGIDELAAHDLLLVVTELVTNAYVHGAGAISLRVERLVDRVRVDVYDEGPAGRIVLRAPGAGGGGGRGLPLVDQVALGWGVAASEAHVWAELPLAA